MLSSDMVQAREAAGHPADVMGGRVEDSGCKRPHQGLEVSTRPLRTSSHRALMDDWEDGVNTTEQLKVLEALSDFCKRDPQDLRPTSTPDVSACFHLTSKLPRGLHQRHEESPCLALRTPRPGAL